MDPCGIIYQILFKKIKEYFFLKLCMYVKYKNRDRLIHKKMFLIFYSLLKSNYNKKKLYFIIWNKRSQDNKDNSFKRLKLYSEMNNQKIPNKDEQIQHSLSESNQILNNDQAYRLKSSKIKPLKMNKNCQNKIYNQDNDLKNKKEKLKLFLIDLIQNKINIIKKESFNKLITNINKMKINKYNYKIQFPSKDYSLDQYKNIKALRNMKSFGNKNYNRMLALTCKELVDTFHKMKDIKDQKILEIKLNNLKKLNNLFLVNYSLHKSKIFISLKDLVIFKKKIEMMKYLLIKKMKIDSIFNLNNSFEFWRISILFKYLNNEQIKYLFNNSNFYAIKRIKKEITQKTQPMIDQDQNKICEDKVDHKISKSFGNQKFYI